MDANNLLQWLSGTSCVLLLLRFAFARTDRAWGWIVVAGLLLVALALARMLIPATAGYAVGTAWVLLVLLPSLGSRLLMWAITRRRHGLALGLSRALAVAHPWDGWREQPRLVHAMALHDVGRFDESVQLLQSLRRTDSPLGRGAILFQARVTGDWTGLRRWIDEHPGRDRLLRDGNLLSGYLRALGETGERQAMVDRYREFVAAGRTPQHALVAGLMTMQVAALAGRVATVEQLMQQSLDSLPPDAKQYWLASAEQVAGHPEAAAERLQPFTDGPGAGMNRAIERRLATPLPPLEPDELDRDALTVLDELADTAEHERRFAALTSTRRPARATWFLVVLIAAVFALETRGGSENIDNLIAMGALVVPTELRPGETWRLFTAGFLHFGPWHVGLNLAGLLILGRWLERAWGSARFLACYLVSTLASTALFPLFSTATTHTVLVGASGGIMGLLGALLCFVLVGRLSGRSALVSRQLGLLLLLVAMQVVFDSTTPIVSSTCHMIGMAVGALFGLAVGLSVARRRD